MKGRSPLRTGEAHFHGTNELNGRGTLRPYTLYTLVEFARLVDVHVGESRFFLASLDGRPHVKRVERVAILFAQLVRQLAAFDGQRGAFRSVIAEVVKLEIR